MTELVGQGELTKRLPWRNLLMTMMTIAAVLFGAGSFASAIWQSRAAAPVAQAETAPRPIGRLPSAPWPGIYAFMDYRHLDPATYPIVGGNYIFYWDEIEPLQDEYRWDVIDRWLEGEAALGKPTGVSFSVYNGVCCGGNAVPTWLFELDPETHVVCDEEWDDDWVIPRYWDDTFLAHYADFVLDAAARYNGDPRIAWIGIGVGMYGETWPAENGRAADYRDCLQAAGLTSDRWVETVNRITDIYAHAFTDTPLLLQFAPAFMRHDERTRFTDHAAELGVGLKHNGLVPDSNIAMWNGKGQYDPMFKWGQQVALAWESSCLARWGRCGASTTA